MGCERTPAQRTSIRLPAAGSLVVCIGPDLSRPESAAVRGGVVAQMRTLPSLRLVCDAPHESAGRPLRAVMADLEREPCVAACVWVEDIAEATAALEPLLSRAALVVTMNQRIDDRRVFGHVEADLAGGAEQMGLALPALARGDPGYLLAHEAARGERAATAYRRFERAAQQQASAQRLDEVDLAATDAPASASLYPPSGAEAAIERLVRRFPRTELLISLAADPWTRSRPGWLRELRQSNPGLRVAVLSSAPDLWAGLRSGYFTALVGPVDGDIGRAAAQLVLDGLMGAEQTGGSRQVPYQLIRAEDLSDFARRYSAAADGLDVRGYLAVPPAGRE